MTLAIFATGSATNFWQRAALKLEKSSFFALAAKAESSCGLYTMDTLDNSNSDSDNPTLQNEMGSALAAQLGQATLQLLQKTLNIKPTLEIRPGYQFNVIVTKDLVFERPYRPRR